MTQPSIGKTEFLNSFVVDGLFEPANEDGVDQGLIDIYLDAQPRILAPGFHSSMSIYPKHLTNGFPDLPQDSAS